jgi:hypothetical protein
MTQKVCATYCSTGLTATDPAYDFFGIENASICRCGNGYGFNTGTTREYEVADGGCLVPASGAPSEAGGGIGRIVVWQFVVVPVRPLPMTCSMLKYSVLCKKSFRQLGVSPDKLDCASAQPLHNIGTSRCDDES